MADALLAEFECPICVSYMTQGSIRQCVLGHLFCSQCFAMIGSCAICRAPKSDVCCQALEKVRSLLAFPCRYKDDGDGCEYTGATSELAVHETMCVPVKCPLQYYKCRWIGKFSKILDHCQLEHKDDILETDSLELLITPWMNVLQHNFKIIRAFGTLFMCFFGIKPNCQMELSVVHVGNPSTTDQFSLNISIAIKHEQYVVDLIPENVKKRTYLIRNKYLTFSVRPNATFERGSRISCILNIYKKDSENVSVDNVTMNLHNMRIPDDLGNSTNTGQN